MTVLVRPRGWQSHTTHTGGCDKRSEMIWKPCPTCWSGGRLYEQTPEGWDVEVCPTCLGVGQIESKADDT